MVHKEFQNTYNRRIINRAKFWINVCFPLKSQKKVFLFRSYRLLSMPIEMEHCLQTATADIIGNTSPVMTHVMLEQTNCLDSSRIFC
jgi:hypothetical protein